MTAISQLRYSLTSEETRQEASSTTANNTHRKKTIGTLRIHGEGISGTTVVVRADEAGSLFFPAYSGNCPYTREFLAYFPANPEGISEVSTPFILRGVARESDCVDPATQIVRFFQPTTLSVFIGNDDDRQSKPVFQEKFEMFFNNHSLKTLDIRVTCMD